MNYRNFIIGFCCTTWTV